MGPTADFCLSSQENRLVILLTNLMNVGHWHQRHKLIYEGDASLLYSIGSTTNLQHNLLQCLYLENNINIYLLIITFFNG